jgi:hypothetical protein
MRGITDLPVSEVGVSRFGSKDAGPALMPGILRRYISAPALLVPRRAAYD